jgi:ferric-dicitrate binding protein FerR (iron transport regulator)
LGDHVVIKPNEQAVSGTSPKLKVNTVDVNQKIAWRMGMFDFDDENLGNILDELSRWYDLKIFYESADLKEVQFTGGLERYENLNQLLELFELTKSVKFLIKEDAILVKKYE